MTNLRHLGISYCDNLTGMPRGLGGLTALQTLPLFIVSRNQRHGTIAELQHLNQIKGELVIRGLHDMMDPKDAMEAKMSSKSGLHSLTLMWDPHEEISQQLQAQEVDVLGYLQPHPNLKCLGINDYGGNRFPNWLRKMDLSSSPLPNLVLVSLVGIVACESLPMLGQLPSLVRLFINGMSALKELGRELYGESAAASGAAFPSLKSMELHEARALEEWAVPAERDAFPCLQTLWIWDCPKLRIQPCLPSSLVELQICGGNEELLAAGGCLQGLSRLRKLHIEEMEASKTSWKGLQYLTALEELTIANCQNLIWLREGVIQHHFSSLHTLSLENLESLGGESDEQQQQKQPPPPLFTSLHHLTLSGCPRLTALPEWLGGLTSLQSLTLEGCQELEMLPDGTRHLAGLKQLTILRCPILPPRCLRETGEDWHKIAHIPNLQIKD